MKIFNLKSIIGGKIKNVVAAKSKTNIGLKAQSKLERAPKADNFEKIPTKKLTADEITDLVLRNI